MSLKVLYNDELNNRISSVQFHDWVPDPGAAQVLDFGITLRSIPPWMSMYSTAATGCIHRIVVTLKVEDSESNYDGFIKELCSIILKTQWNNFKYVKSYFFCLLLMSVQNFIRKESALDLWKERCSGGQVTPKPFFIIALM
jgi:hypothetical protein